MLDLTLNTTVLWFLFKFFLWLNLSIFFVIRIVKALQNNKYIKAIYLIFTYTVLAILLIIGLKVNVRNVDNGFETLKTEVFNYKNSNHLTQEQYNEITTIKNKEKILNKQKQIKKEQNQSIKDFDNFLKEIN